VCPLLPPLFLLAMACTQGPEGPQGPAFGVHAGNVTLQETYPFRVGKRGAFSQRYVRRAATGACEDAIPQYPSDTLPGRGVSAIYRTPRTGGLHPEPLPLPPARALTLTVEL
jgi:hypothetical protein